MHRLPALVHQFLYDFSLLIPEAYEVLLPRAVYQARTNSLKEVYLEAISKPIAALTYFQVLKPAILACSPKVAPCVMRVQRPARARRTFDEGQEAPSGTDHPEAS